MVAVSCGRQVSARKLKPHPPRPRSLHERLLEDIKAERKLRPVSPDMIRRSRLGMRRGVNVVAAFRCSRDNQWSDAVLSPAAALYELKHLTKTINRPLSITSIIVYSMLYPNNPLPDPITIGASPQNPQWHDHR